MLSRAQSLWMRLSTRRASGSKDYSACYRVAQGVRYAVRCIVGSGLSCFAAVLFVQRRGSVMRFWRDFYPPILDEG